MDSLLEQLADAEHESWGRWMAYLFSVCTKHDDGSYTIPPDLAAHWRRMIDTPYSDLTETSKDSDREEVRRILPLIEAAGHPGLNG